MLIYIPIVAGGNYVFMVDYSHEVQLPIGPLGIGVILKCVFQLLDCHSLLQDCVRGRTKKLNQNWN